MPEIEMSQSDFDRAFTTCDTAKAHDAVAEMSYRHTTPADIDMILLNGPAGSGKTWLANHIKAQLFPSGYAEIITVPEVIYSLMKLCTYRDSYGLTSQLPQTDLPYAEFKALPGGRNAIITVANRLRMVDPRIIDRAVYASQLKDETQVVIIDNVGSAAEAEFLTQGSTRWCLITIKYPRDVYLGQEVGDVTRRRRLAEYDACYMNHSYWPNDYRGPVNPALVGGYVDGASLVLRASEQIATWPCPTLSQMIADSQPSQGILPLEADDI